MRASLKERISAGRAKPLHLIASPPLFVLAVLLWWKSWAEWKTFWHEASGSTSLGYDIKFSWLAAKVFSHGGDPYSIAGFVYPPSHALLAWPLAAFSFSSVKNVGLYVMIAAMWGTVIVSARAFGFRYWGVIAALSVLALRFTQPVGDEIVLENVSALIALGFAIFVLLASREHWYAAGAVLAVTLAIKPLLAPVLLVFLLAKQFRPLFVAIGLLAALNVAAFFAVDDIGKFWSALPFIFDRSGAGYNAYNAALVSIGHIIGMPDVLDMAIRVVAVALAVGATLLAWKRIEDPATRIVTSASMLLIGLYLGGSLTEDHYMLTLAPLAVSIVGKGSPIRVPTAWIGFAWIMAYRDLSPNLLGLSGLNAGLDAQAICRCIGMGLVLMTVLVTLWLQDDLARRTQRITPTKDRLQRSFARA